MNSITISPIEYFMLAGGVGKAVILILVAASIWSWVQIIEGIVGVIRLKRAIGRWRSGGNAGPLASVMEAGKAASNFRLAGESIGEARQRVTEAMNRDARSVIVAVEGGLANLAVISSVAPFVGLFGTVWGIMTSFAAIAAAKDTSLATVAPGIAEALMTTALGLAAAIPSSVGYTRIGGAIGAAAHDIGGLIEEAAVKAMMPTPARKPIQEVA